MLRIFLLGILMLTLASCGLIRNTAGSLGVGRASASRAQVEINDTRFRARAHPEAEDKRSFAVTVSPVAVDPTAAMEAGRYQATRYCLLTYGGSDTDWTIGPDTPLSQLPVADDTATLRGRCTHR